MKRYGTNVRDGVLSIEGTDGRFEVDELDKICELVGGETYTVEYSDSQRTVDWLDTDAEGHTLRTAVFADRMTSIWDPTENLENG